MGMEMGGQLREELPGCGDKRTISGVWASPSREEMVSGVSPDPDQRGVEGSA